MPKPRSSRLETPTARLKLPVRFRPYPGPSLARGIKLLYRRNKGPGVWVVKAANGHGQYWTKALAASDDLEPADGRAVLSFYQAQAAAKKLARGGDSASDAKPLTVEGALDAYEADLGRRGADKGNATRVRPRLPTSLAGKPVSLLTTQDLRHWRDGLLAKGVAPATVNRTRMGLRAALELAASMDPRIKNREAFRTGLKGLPGAGRARRVVLPDSDVNRIVKAAYAEDEALGVLVQTLAETGSRMSQVERLACADLQAAGTPRLLMPASFKGKRRQKERDRVPVPITGDLAARLAAMASGRNVDDPLLIQRDGQRWFATSRDPLRRPLSQAVAAAGLDPDTITSYSLRHSCVCRMLLAGTPISVVARLLDTSAQMIESNYAAFIADFSDQLARQALLAPAPQG